MNALILCASCHFFFHRNPVEFGIWFALEFPERLTAIKKMRGIIFKTSIGNLSKKLDELKIIWEEMVNA